MTQGYVVNFSDWLVAGYADAMDTVRVQRPEGSRVRISASDNRLNS